VPLPSRTLAGVPVIKTMRVTSGYDRSGAPTHEESDAMKGPMPNNSVEAVRSYYRAILPFYNEESEDRGDLAFWRLLVAERKPECILELGAGTGRVTAALAKLAPVVAIDLSPEMLQQAAARLERQSTSRSVSSTSQPVASTSRSVSHGAAADLFPVELIVADMRSLDLGRRFDLIVAPNDPFSHITRQRERQTALRAIAHHLLPGGRLVIEGLYRPERRRIVVPERLANGISVRELWEPFGAHDRWRARYSYARRAQDGSAEQMDAEFFARAWNPPKAKRLFQGCGLDLREMWGDFDRRPFTPEAERVLIVAGPVRSG
jgi:SAM-dependent methyltransferase